MAIYHASIKNFSKAKGDSSIAAAAYRAGLDLVDTRTKELHRYSQRKGVVAVRMLAPAGSPDWCSHPDVFWDANQQGESRKNALVARELEVSLPHELSELQRLTLATELGQLLVDRYKCVVMVAVHEPVGGSDSRNHHTHLLMSARQVDHTGLGNRAASEFDARGGRGADEIRLVRELVGNLINAHLAFAGVEIVVDHRSLKDQAIVATLKGDHKLAIRLTRVPDRHQGKVLTHMQREADATPSLSPDALMAQALTDAAARGVLAATPVGHSHSSALADRIVARRANAPIKPVVAWGRALRPQRAGQPSYTALRLSRLGRIARTSGAGAEVLNAEAALIEAWLESTVAAAEAALESVQVIPSVQLDRAFVDSLATLRTRRVEVYGMKDGLFEDTEALSWAIQNYAAAMRRPHDNRVRLTKGLAKLSEVENPAEPGTPSQVRRARNEAWKAKRGISKGADIECARRIQETRTLMIAAKQGIERDFHITQWVPPTSNVFGPFEEGGGADTKKTSESNTRELRPKPPTQSPSGSIGMRH